MAKIVFMVDLEEGHLFPTFSLAHSLKEAKFEILYMALPDSEDLIRSAGFDFFPLYSKYYPKGFKKEYKELVLDDKHRGFDRHFEDFADGSFDMILAKIKADIFIVSSFFNIEMLILYYKYNLKPIILSPRLYDSATQLSEICTTEIYSLPADMSMHLINILEERKLKYSTFREIAAPINEFNHFIICSKNFDKKGPAYSKNTFYIGSKIQQFLSSNNKDSIICNGKRIIYASMGSQSQIYKTKFNFLFSKLLRIMQRDEMRDFYLIFSSGGNDLNLEHNVDYAIPNISIVKWVNQIKILEKSSLAFIHGGLNTIKECIYSGVPMIVIPGSRDQPANAEQVEYHKMGIVIDIESISENDLLAAMFNALNDHSIRRNVLEMKDKFEQLDKEEIGVSIVKEIIESNRNYLYNLDVASR